MSKDFEIKGLDKLNNQLDRMAKKTESLSKKSSVSFEELFTDGFIKKHSKYSSFKEFAAAGGFDVSSADSFKAIPDKEWDVWIAQSSDLSGWQDMQQTAAVAFAKKQLGF